MEPAPVALRDVPPGSVFPGGKSEGQLHSPQGTVIDGSASCAQPNADRTTVLELQRPTVGLTWTAGDDSPMDGQVRGSFPGMPARELGTLIHREIAQAVREWPGAGVGVWSQQGFLEGFRPDVPVLPLGASRIDILGDAGRGTVCVYDIKTGDSDMRPKQLFRYWQEALLFRAGTPASKSSRSTRSADNGDRQRTQGNPRPNLEANSRLPLRTTVALFSCEPVIICAA